MLNGLKYLPSIISEAFIASNAVEYKYGLYGFGAVARKKNSRFKLKRVHTVDENSCPGNP